MEWKPNSLSSIWRRSLPQLLIAAALASCVRGQAASCNASTQCGSNSQCTLDLVCMCNSSYFSLSGLNNDCMSANVPDPRCAQQDSNCVFCGTDLSGPCSACAVSYFLIESSRSCVSDCPGTVSLRSTTVIANNVVLTRLCEGGSGGSSSALPQWAVIVIGVGAGVVVLAVIGVVMGVSIYILTKSSTRGQFDVEDSQKGVPDSRSATLRTRRSNSFSYHKHKQENEKKADNRTLSQPNPAFEEIDGDDETVFRHKLDYLRSQAEIFLKMLNDMRRRLKELPPDAPAAVQYRNVMQDVTRLLYLLNKKPSTVEMPADGLQLLKWSQQILERYLTSQGMAPRPWQTNRLSVLGPQEETQF